MAQQRAHDVHLRVARAGVRARAVDLLEDDRRLGDVEATAAVLLRDQRGEPARVGERLDERIGIAGTLVDVLPVRAVELSAQLANSIAIFLVFVCSWIDVSHSRDSGFGTRDLIRAYRRGANPTGSRAGAAFRRPNEANSVAMSAHRSMECTALTAACAVASPKREPTSAVNLFSSSPLEIGFSALPLG